MNGYSNEYWGWGAEDDDMYVRILHSCLGLERANYEVAKYVLMYFIKCFLVNLIAIFTSVLKS